MVIEYFHLEKYMSFIDAITNAITGKLPQPTERTTPQCSTNVQSVLDMNNIKIPTLLKVDAQVLETILQDNETLIWKYMLKQIKAAVLVDAPTAILFLIESESSELNDTLAVVHREQFEVKLNEIISHFIKIEEYERIPKCKELLDKHKINDLTRM
jgi:hypothetical protein